jgi:hypothetical protein
MDNSAQITPEMARAELARRASQGKVTPEMARAELERRKASAPATADDEWDRASMWPFAKNKRTGDIDFAVPGILKSIGDAVGLPGRVYSGEQPLRGEDGQITDDVIKQSLDLAGVATPMSPGSRLAKAPMPSSQLPPTPGQNVAMAGERLGVKLPRAVTSDKMAVQQMGKVATNVPIGGTPLRKASQNAIDDLGKAATRVQEGYGTGNTAAAGGKVRAGISDYAKNTIPAQVSKRYDAVDDLVSNTVKTPLSATAKAAKEIASRRSNAAISDQSNATRLVEEAISKQEGLSYEGIKNLRTYIGEMVKDPRLMPANTSQAELKQIYGALSDDLRNAVKTAGGDRAAQAFERANSFKAKTAGQVKALDKIVGTGSDEALSGKLLAMAGSTGRADIKNLYRARVAAGKESWDELASSALATMGRDVEGNFSPDRFVTAWGKLSKQGKTALFGTTGKKELAKSLDDIAAVSSRFKELQQFANPSGTAQNVIGGSIGAGVFFEPLTVISSVAGARGASYYLSKPQTAKQIAQWAKAYEQVVRKPTVAGKSLFAERSKALSLSIANDLGAPNLARSISEQLSGGAIKSVAEDEGQNPQQGNEIENRNPQAARPYNPFET